MSIEREQRILELLDGVLEQPPAQRSRFLDRECADDSSILRQVESMLETESAPGRPDLKPVFDVYADDDGVKLDRDKKSIAYSLTYRDESRTLESAEVDAAHAKVLESLQQALPAKLR